MILEGVHEEFHLFRFDSKIHFFMHVKLVKNHFLITMLYMEGTMITVLHGKGGGFSPPKVIANFMYDP